MKLDRQIQLALLKRLAAAYPDPLHDVVRDLKLNHSDGIANLYYLTEHKLVYAKFIRHQGQPMMLNGSQTISAAGMDFLADDGGVSAILGTVTVRFHEDTLKQMIEMRLAEAQLPTEEKNRLLQSVRELPSDSIKHLTTKLLDLGMDNLPRAVELIRTVLT